MMVPGASQDSRLPEAVRVALGRCRFGRRVSTSLSALDVCGAFRRAALRRSAWVRSGTAGAEALQ